LIERHRPPSGEPRHHDVERLEAGEVERAEAWAVGLLRSFEGRPAKDGTPR
jgi:hypothetical protein